MTPCFWGRDGKRSRTPVSLIRGQYLAFDYDGDETLSVKIFCADGGHEDCCMESDSSSRSCCYDDEDEDEDEEDYVHVKVERSPPS